MKERIIVFAPHPDDETFGCGGLIAKRLSENCEVLVVVLTDGKYAFQVMFGIDSEPTPDELQEIRKEEVKRATKILGLPEKNLLFLDFEDGTLEKNQTEVKRKVLEILKKSCPAEVYFTYEKDVNSDHYITSRIVKDAVRELGLDTATYEYSVVRKYARIGPVIDRWLSVFKRNMVHVDIAKFLHLKAAALREFKSEVTILSPRQPRPIMENIESYLKDREPFFICR